MACWVCGRAGACIEGEVVSITTPQLQARIETLPVEQWKSELEKIVDEAVRTRVRSHLETVYKMRNKHTVLQHHHSQKTCYSGRPELRNNMQYIILILLILGLIYFPVETIVITVGVSLIGLIRHVVKKKEIAGDRARTKNAYERLTNPDYARPRWFLSPPALYATIAIVIALLVYFY